MVLHTLSTDMPTTSDNLTKHAEEVWLKGLIYLDMCKQTGNENFCWLRYREEILSSYLLIWFGTLLIWCFYFQKPLRELGLKKFWSVVRSSNSSSSSSQCEAGFADITQEEIKPAPQCSLPLLQVSFYSNSSMQSLQLTKISITIISNFHSKTIFNKILKYLLVVRTYKCEQIFQI